jgi:O-antigen ligase
VNSDMMNDLRWMGVPIVTRMIRPVVQFGAALGIGSVLGVAALCLGPFTVLAVVAGLVVALATFSYPEFVILLLLCLVLPIIPAWPNPYFRLAGRGFFASDLVLMWLLAVILLRSMIEKDFTFRRTPLDVPLLFTVGATLVAVGTAVSKHGVNLSDTTYELRIILYYLVFFAVTNLIRTKDQLQRLIGGIFIVGAVMAGMLVISVTFGDSVGLTDPTLKMDEEVVRVFNPGWLIVYLTIVPLVVNLARGAPWAGNVISPALLLLECVSLLLTLGRNLIISSAASLLVLVGLLNSSQRSRLMAKVVVGIFVAALAVAILTAADSESKLLRYIPAFLDRFRHLFEVGIEASTETLTWRTNENRYAWSHIIENPLLGIGLFSAYRPPFFVGDTTLIRFIHNAYLWFWLRTGLLGLAAFLWLSFRFLQRGLGQWSSVEDGFGSSLVLGFSLAYLALMISNIVAPSFVQSMSATALAVTWGISEVLLAPKHSESRYSKEG